VIDSFGGRFPSTTSRDAVKKKFMQFMYHNSNNKWAGDPEVNAIKDIFPTLTEVFREIKKFDYKALPILLQYLERYLTIDVICQRIHTVNALIPLFTIHDSIVTTEEFVPLVEAVMLEELTAAIGYPPTLAIEAWQYENLK
jgi:hypothetical protein